VRVASGTKAITRHGELRIEQRLQNLIERLLNQTVQYRRDGQCKLHCPTVLIWDGRRFVIHFIHFEGSALKCLRSDA